jgi:integrase
MRSLLRRAGERHSSAAPFPKPGFYRGRLPPVPLKRKTDRIIGLICPFLPRRTLLHLQGTPLKVAQAQLGHSHMATTLEIYTHASVIVQREAVNLLDEQVFPSVPKNADGNRSKADVASPTS